MAIDISRRQLLSSTVAGVAVGVGAVAVPAAANAVTVEYGGGEITPVVDPHDLYAKFCGVQTAHNDIIFAMGNVINPDLICDKTMSFSISKIKTTEPTLMHATPRTLLDRLPTVVVDETGKQLWFAFERLANRVARESRRGRGNTLLFSHALSPNFLVDHPAPRCKNADCPDLPKNEYVIMYHGSSPYDAAIFQVHGVATKPLYVPNKDWEKYAVRFRVVPDLSQYSV